MIKSSKNVKKSGRFFILFLFVFYAQTGLVAQASRDPYPSQFRYVEKGNDTKDLAITEVEISKNYKLAEKIASRKPAQVQSKAEVSPELAGIVSAFSGEVDTKGNITKKGITDVKELQALIDKSNDEKYYEALPLDAKFTVAQLSLLNAFKGFLYRVRPFAKQANITHSILLTMVRNIIAGSLIYIPTDQMKVIVDYISEPQDNMPYIGKDSKIIETVRIHNADQFQTYLNLEVLPEVEHLKKRMKDIVNLMSDSESFSFDNRILYGASSFQDNVERYRKIGLPEMWGMLSGCYTALSQLNFTLAYSLTDIVPVIKKLGELQGVDTLFGWDVQGSPAKERIDVLSDSKYHLFEFNAITGHVNMYNAFTYMRNAYYQGDFARVALKERDGSDQFVFDSNFIKSNYNRTNLSSRKMKEMFKGQAEVRSQITGHPLIVDLPNFFNNPPSNLRSFLPNHFENGPEEMDNPKKSFMIGSIKVEDEYRNYHYHEADGWDINAYKPYFPSLNVNKSGDDNKDREANSEELKEAARILIQSYGGSLMASIIGPNLI